MKMKAGFSLEQITLERIERMARATRRDKSSIVDMAIELLSQQDEFSHLEKKTQPNKRTTRSQLPEAA